MSTITEHPAGQAQPDTRPRMTIRHRDLLAVAVFLAVVALAIGAATQWPVLDIAAATLTLTAAAGLIINRPRRSAVAATLAAAAALGSVAALASSRDWLFVPWTVLAVSATAVAGIRLRKRRRSRRWQTLAGRIGLTALMGVASLTLLFAHTPRLPTPTGPYAVGTETWVWTDASRVEPLAADGEARRQVAVQAFYPTDATAQASADYIGAPHRVTFAAGLPAWLTATLDGIDTHAGQTVPVSTDRGTWPVVVFSPGLNVARQAYTGLVVELASRGYVVIAMSHTYDSPATVVEGRVVDADVAAMDTFDEVPAQIEKRSADASFVLDQLWHLEKTAPESALVGHLDLDGVGIVGHSTGGATAVAALASDARFTVGVNMDGRLFGHVPHLRRPLLWFQSAASGTDDPAHEPTRRTRDQLLARMLAPTALVTLVGGAHLSFSDYPTYFTPLGLRAIGSLPGAQVGTLPARGTTPAIADVLASFLGPRLGGPSPGPLEEVAQQHAVVRLDR